MPNQGRREVVLNAIRNALGYIKTGTEIDYCDDLPKDLYSFIDPCISTDGWTYNSEGETPTLDESLFIYGGASINLGKKAGGNTVIYEKTLSVPVDATNLTVGGMYFYYTGIVALHATQGLEIRIGSDDSNYYRKQYGNASLDLDVLVNYGWVFADEDVIGTPDIGNIAYISVRIRTTVPSAVIPLGDAKMDLWFLFNPEGWFPFGGASMPPKVFTDGDVAQGTACVGFGKFGFAEVNCSIMRDFAAIGETFDLTGGEIETWFKVHDKTKLFEEAAPGFPSIYIIVGNAVNKFYMKYIYYADIQDQVNDKTSGWNKIRYNIEDESDLAINSPDISDITLIGLIVTADAIETEIPLGDLRTDFWRAFDVEEEIYNLDVEGVYRYKMNVHQVPVTPSIVMAAMDEDCESKVYPTMYRTLQIGLDGWIHLTDEDLLDKELGKFADDIQVALFNNTQLSDIVQFVAIRKFEFSVRKGTQNYGVLTIMISVGYVVNQKNPALEG